MSSCFSVVLVNVMEECFRREVFFCICSLGIRNTLKAVFLFYFWRVFCQMFMVFILMFLNNKIRDTISCVSLSTAYWRSFTRIFWLLFCWKVDLFVGFRSFLRRRAKFVNLARHFAGFMLLAFLLRRRTGRLWLWLFRRWRWSHDYCYCYSNWVKFIIYNDGQLNVISNNSTSWIRSCEEKKRGMMHWRRCKGVGDWRSQKIAIWKWKVAKGIFLSQRIFCSILLKATIILLLRYFLFFFILHVNCAEFQFFCFIFLTFLFINIFRKRFFFCCNRFDSLSIFQSIVSKAEWILIFSLSKSVDV